MAIIKKGFVIDSLPRTGSTTLARLLDCHPDIKCLVEPFHPRRYNGQYYRMAMQAKSVESALNLIWHRWNGIKHVWVGPTGFPFPQDSELNNGIILSASHVIFLERRNLLRRYVSSMISRQLDFWIGTRQEFQARLENIQLRELEPNIVFEEIRKDKLATERRLELLRAHNLRFMHLIYEEVFGEGVSYSRQFETLNAVLNFLGYNEVAEGEFQQKWAPLLDRDTYQWASVDIYRMIPGIERLEQELGSDEIGWLF
jgi:hypothetical protein